MADDSYPGSNLLVGAGRWINKTPTRKTGGVFLWALSPEAGLRPTSKKYGSQLEKKISKSSGHYPAMACPIFPLGP